MPAIHLPRLRKQAVELAEYFFEPQRFDFHFNQLLDYYANRTIKPGKQTSSKTQIKAYRVQDPVLKIIMTEVAQSAAQSPADVLILSRLLWDDLVLEKRIFAARLLKYLPQEDSHNVLIMIENWAQSCHEDQLLSEFADYPLLKIYSLNWQLYLGQMKEWLESDNDTLKRLALISIAAVLKEHDIDDLPPLFKILQPYFSKPPFIFRTFLNPIFKYLTHQSPDEVMYLVRQINDSQQPQDKNFNWLLRQNLEHFPVRHQESLESIIKNK